MKYKNTLWNIIILLIIILLLVSFSDSLSEAHLCDSGSINDVNNTNNDNHNNDYVISPDLNLTRLSLTDRIRRRISWCITGKNSGKCGTYTEFKTSWNPETKVWKDIKLAIKKDFEKSRLNAQQARQKSKIDGTIFMSDIKQTRELQNENNINRLNSMFNPSRKK